MSDDFTIEVVCLSCDVPLVAVENKEYQSGDFIKCKDCGELNDYNEAVDNAAKKGLEKIKSRMSNKAHKQRKLS